MGQLRLEQPVSLQETYGARDDTPSGYIDDPAHMQVITSALRQASMHVLDLKPECVNARTDMQIFTVI